MLDYIHEGQIEAFEGFEDFDLIAFDWYDVRSERDGSIPDAAVSGPGGPVRLL